MQDILLFQHIQDEFSKKCGHPNWNTSVICILAISGICTNTLRFIPVNNHNLNWVVFALKLNLVLILLIKYVSYNYY